MSTHDTNAEPAALDADQATRAQALHEARRVLAVNAGPFTTKPVDPVDLVTVAQWVIDGEDPWAQAPGRVSAEENEATSREIAAHPHRALIEDFAEISFDIANEHDASGGGMWWHRSRALAEIDQQLGVLRQRGWRAPGDPSTQDRLREVLDLIAIARDDADTTWRRSSQDTERYMHGRWQALKDLHLAVRGLGAADGQSTQERQG